MYFQKMNKNDMKYTRFTINFFEILETARYTSRSAGDN